MPVGLKLLRGCGSRCLSDLVQPQCVISRVSLQLVERFIDPFYLLCLTFLRNKIILLRSWEGVHSVVLHLIIIASLLLGTLINYPLKKSTCRRGSTFLYVILKLFESDHNDRYVIHSFLASGQSKYLVCALAADLMKALILITLVLSDYVPWELTNFLSAQLIKDPIAP